MKTRDKTLLTTLLVLLFVAVISSVSHNVDQDPKSDIAKKTPEAVAEETESDFGRYSIGGVHLGMNEQETQKALGLASPQLVRGGFMLICFDCGAVDFSLSCGHPAERSGTIVLSGGLVDGLFAANLEKDGKLVLTLKDSMEKVVDVLGEPRERDDDYAGQILFNYRQGDDTLSVSFEAGGIYDIYLVRETEAGNRKIQEWVDRSGEE